MEPKSTTRFLVRAYSKKELALIYFPDTNNSHSAVVTLMAWINRCDQLREALETQGYRKTSKCFTPKEVELIVAFFGEPEA